MKRYKKVQVEKIYNFWILFWKKVKKVQSTKKVVKSKGDFL